MAKGITIESGSPRTLALEGVEVAQGGSANQAGLYAVGDKLYLDGEEIADATGATGLLISGSDVTFNGQAVGSDTPTPPTPPAPSSGLWIPPAQVASTYNKYDYQSLIEAYDNLMSNSAYPGIIKKYEYTEDNLVESTIYDSEGGAHTKRTCTHDIIEVPSGSWNEGGDVLDIAYPLYHYVFTPSGGYTKTFIVQVCVHGNEKDAPQTNLRIFDIICNHCNEAAYSRLAQLRDNVRFIVIPCINPVGFNVTPLGSMNVSERNWDGEYDMATVNGQPVELTLNMNRNYDLAHSFGLDGGGKGGNYPFERSEIRHVKAVVEKFGAHNIDYLFDNHDGGTVTQHYWFNFNMDGPNAVMATTLLADIIAYEEQLIADGGTDYRQPNDPNADANGWVHQYVADSAGYNSGIAAAWANVTMGIPASVSEYIGGYFGYSFDPEQMTRSLRFRANLMIYAYEMVNTKGWLINEAQDADYFHFDNPVGMMRQGLRMDGAPSSKDNKIVVINDVYARWDALTSANPSYVTKSAKLGENSSGDSIYSYTLGNGSKKVLFIGGDMRWGAAHKETEFGIYILAEYLCNDYIVNQSEFLKRLKQDYTIVVIPCIDINAGGNTSSGRPIGLNAAGFASTAKWKEANNVCIPTDYALNTASDVPIFLSWLSANQDACVLVGGGEDTSGYLYERPKYTTDYMTQFVVPRTQAIPSWLTGYCTHLENDRGEDEPSVVRTSSVTDATYGNVGLTCGDYAYDTYGIPAYFINLKVSNKWAERQQYIQSGDTASSYMYRTYETGRRIANIVNIFLMAGGDIAAGGGLVNKN